MAARSTGLLSWQREEAISQSPSSLWGERVGSLYDCRVAGHQVVEVKWISSLAMPGPKPLQARALTPETMETGQALWQVFSDPSQWWDNKCHKKSPGSPHFRHKRTNQALWIEGCSRPPLVQAALAAMIRGRGDGVKNNTGGSCGDVRTPFKTGQLKAAAHILNKQDISADSNTYVSILRECLKFGDLKMGKRVHAHIIQSGLYPHISLLNLLLNMYAKCRSMADARQVFDKMPERDVFTWTIMTSGYAKHGYGKEALNIYQQMIQERVTPDKVMFISVLKACASLGALEKGREVHAQIIKTGIGPDIVLETALAVMYAKCGNMKDARQVFDNMGHRDVVSWNSMIAGYAQHGCAREALEVYDEMIREGLIPDKVSFVSAINACASLGDLGRGTELHGDFIKAGLTPDVILETALVDMYAKGGNMKNAQQVFDSMAQRNVFSWNAMIGGYAKLGCGTNAFEIYEQMIQEGLKPDKVTFICVLNACASLAALEKGKVVHADIIKAGIVRDIMMQNALVHMYAKCGSLDDARQMFSSMAEKDVISWSSMIAGYAQHGYGMEAWKMYEQMVLEGVMPNNITFISVLNACASLAALEKGKQVHADIIRAGLVPDIVLQNTLVDMYAKCGEVNEARQLFNSMAQRTVVSWSVMITGYAQHGYGMEAFDMYEQMIREGVTPDKVTFVCVLNACSSLAALEKGKEVHAKIIKARIGPDIILETALAGMYAKCGNMREARQVFDSMGQRDVISWNTIIAGYAQQGCGKEAFEIYKQMIREGVMPDSVTFICVLSACSSLAGLEKGREIHADIIKARIAPDILMENALVYMYAKCGSIVDAHHLFNNMTGKNVVSWSAMIAGYAQHGGGREALKLFEQMQQEDLKPNGITFICVLSACSHVGLVDEGRHYFDSMSRDHGLTPTVEHFGCMVDLLGRAGQLNEAEELINKMPIEPGVAVWRALLGACRIHGNVEVAERVAKCLLKLDPQDSASYVLLSNIYDAAGRWDDRVKVRKMMLERGVT